MIRLFVALELPEDVRAALARLRSGIPGARWVEPENLHITLRFIGEVEEGTARDIDAALAEIEAPAFEVALAEIGTFGSGRRLRALWAGVERNPALVHIHDKVERALVRLGLEPEGRKFAPHVTLARLRDAPAERVNAFVAGNNLFRARPFTASHFTLFSSVLGRGGSVYQAEAEYPLAG